MTVDPAVSEAIEQISEQLPEFAQALQYERSGFEYWPCLSESCYENRDILDFGCGIGAGSAVFLERGAAFVWGIDPSLGPEQMERLQALPRSRFTCGWLEPEVFAGQQFDLVYARFVTEHVRDLPATLCTVYDLLRPGGRFVAQHDNYYSPMGAHDHVFIWPVKPNALTYRTLAPACWKATGRCEVSAEFRREIEEYDMAYRSWVLTPEDCRQCPFYQRAQLWGHLLAQDSFNQAYLGDYFKSSRGSLNKVTPFQLRQFIIEAGFEIDTWITPQVTNRPPRQLTKVHLERDLRTLNIVVGADKPAE